MLFYRHLFHAGNFADVFKHALLCRLLIALGGKGRPYCYLDTHAGIGRYDLAHEWAQKAREFENGIGRIWDRKDSPDALLPYLEIVRGENPRGRLRSYPGSPLFALKLRRAGDRLVLTELNETDCAELAGTVSRARDVTVQRMDGYQALKAFLPPKERRGLVLIDSSFDRSGEFPRLARSLKTAHERWPTGVYALWYPMMGSAVVEDFARAIVRTRIRKILRLEMLVRSARDRETVPGCGMIIVNPPWKLDAETRPLVDWLAAALAQDNSAHAKVDWLVPE